MNKPRIRVKLIARGENGSLWARQTPQGAGLWGDCEFLFDLDEQDYDWLVVIDDVSRRYNSEPLTLRCADEHTLLVTSEPPTITRYGRAFSAQFAHVLTSQNARALPHPKRIHSHTGNLWFNGHSFDEITASDFQPKSKTLSTVCSSKQQKHTLHNKRYEFTQGLLRGIPEMDLFGHGTQYIEHKHEALDPYKYHLAVENYVGLHHWTEKISDPFLSKCVPIYCGCPNVADYFPEESFIQIDINKPDEALDIITQELSDQNAYLNRGDALREARELVLHQYNLTPMLEQLIMGYHDGSRVVGKSQLYGRKQMRMRHPGDLFSHILWSARKSKS